MFTLQQKQISTFEKIEVDKFVQKTMVFLKYNYQDWAKNKSDEELKKYVLEVIDLGKKYAVYKEVNIQKLLFLNRQFSFSLPLTFAHRSILMEKELNEDIRIKQFYKLLSKNQSI